MAAEGRPFGVRRGTLPGLAATAGALPLARARRRRGLGACAVLARPLLAALVLLAAANVASAQPSPLDDATLSRYPLDWNLVPLTPSNATNLTANCICDLRQDACDLGCCCDPVCTPGLVGLFEDSGRCLPEGPPSQTLSFCVPSGNVFTVNLPSTSDFYVVVKQPADQEFWSQLLCIVSDSNPDVGYQYPDPPPGNEGDNANLAQCPAAVSPPQKITNYQLASLVYVQRAAVTAPLTVPYPAFSSVCNDQMRVGYLIPLPSGVADVYSSCERSTQTLDLSVECSAGGLLSPDYYSDLLVYTGTSTTATTTFRITQMQYLSTVNGTLTTVDPTTIVTSFNNATGLCSNAIRYVNITFYYSITDTSAQQTPGYINAADLTFIVTDIPAETRTYLQSMRVAWMPFVNNNQPQQLTDSGNPGYIAGLPVLAGTETSLTYTNGTTRTAISQLASGMPIAGQGAGGACDPTALTSARFGFNSSSSCSVSLTAAQLRDFCLNEAANPQKYVAAVMSSLYQQVLDNLLYLGIWGNSNYTNIEQWVQVAVSGYPFNPSIYSAADNACSGVVTGFDLQIVTGVAFASNNLQSKVLYGNLCFKTGVWDFAEELGTSNAQRFFLNFGVSYIPLPQQAEFVKKPAPPLVTPLPADIFYPFVSSDAPPRPRFGAAALAAALLTAALLAAGRGGAGLL